MSSWCGYLVTEGMFAQLLAEQLEHLLMVLTAESVKGAMPVLPLLIYPRHSAPQANRLWGAAGAVGQQARRAVSCAQR